MTRVRMANGKRLVLVGGRAHPALAREIVDELGIDLLPVTAYDFANSKIYVRFEEPVRGADVLTLRSHADPINTWLMEQLIMVDAAKRVSAKRITVVAPYYPYARQDEKHKGYEPISARFVASLFRTTGVDRIMFVDLYAAQPQGFFSGPIDRLWAMPILVEYIHGRIDVGNAAVVSPDAGQIKVAEQWGNRLGGVSLAFVYKIRDLTCPNQATANRVVGDVSGRTAVIVDDLIDTAGTICGAVRIVLEAGAKDVIVAAIHGVLSDLATQRPRESGLRELVVTDAFPIGPEKRFPAMTVLPIAPVLARAVDEVLEDGSVTGLFDGAY